MKQVTKTTGISLLLIIIIILSETQKAKTNAAAPPTGGLSGDPARSTCAFIGCHYGTTGATYTFGPGELTLNMGDTTTTLAPMAGQTYVSGQTYYIQLRPNLTNGSTPRYGFQMTSLDAAGNMTGAFTTVNAGRNTAETLLSRNYISHKNANSNNQWIFQWTAPSSTTGPVTFYFACNMCNGDNSVNGDSIYTGTVVLNPGFPSGISSPGSAFEYLEIYPNPAKDFMMVSFKNMQAGQAKISLYTLDGKNIQTQGYDVQTSSLNNIRYDLPASLSPGVYLLQLEVGNCRSVQRVVIM